MVRQIDKLLYKYWEEYFMKSTPHIKPMNDVEIAETVLLPGDPLRAKFIAETYFGRCGTVQYSAKYVWFYRNI